MKPLLLHAFVLGRKPALYVSLVAGVALHFTANAQQPPADKSKAPMPASVSAPKAGAAAASSAEIERGRYLIRITGCNDCHTVGYPESGGKLDEKQWLTGSPVGWQGDWGTTYPSNLRLVVQRMDEAQWLKHARNEWRPPMPWFALRDMTDQDLKAIYRFVRQLGAAGTAAPAYVPPGKPAPQPIVIFPAAPK